MTMSEFDTLRSDLRSMRADMDARFGHMDTRFAKLEAKIDEKPGVGTIYQAALAMFAGMFAVMAGTIVMLKAAGIIP